MGISGATAPSFADEVSAVRRDGGATLIDDEVGTGADEGAVLWPETATVFHPDLLSQLRRHDAAPVIF